ncbi:MAG: hypothetical protein WAW88_07735 [Nocardioides sp.]
MFCPPECPTAGFGGGLNQNSWSLVSTGSFSQGANQRVGYYSSYGPWSGTSNCTGATGGTGGGSLSGVILGEADPTSPGSTLSYQKVLCLTAGVTYTFFFRWNSYNINTRAAFLSARILNPAGTVVATALQVNAPAAAANTSGSRTFTYTPTVSEYYTYSYRWTFSSTPSSYTGCDLFANDIGVTAPTITCT